MGWTVGGVEGRAPEAWKAMTGGIDIVLSGDESIVFTRKC